MEEFVHCPDPYLLLLAIPDEILSRMIEIWVENYLVSDSNCNAINLQPPNFYFLFNIFLQGMTNNIVLAFSVGDTTPRFTINIEQDNENWWH